MGQIDHKYMDNVLKSWRYDIRKNISGHEILNPNAQFTEVFK